MEFEGGDWLLVDVELIEEDVVILNDYVVVDEWIFWFKNGGVKFLLIEEVSEGKIKKFKKYFYGKMILRVFLRKIV